MNSLPLRGRPHHKFVDRMVREGTWKLETVPASITGLTRDMIIYRAPRNSSFITYVDHSDEHTCCPACWSDIRIGCGPCGLGCRACFLMLTRRGMNDPLRPLVYNNVETCWRAVRRWLADQKRTGNETLGLGIDSADSLLLEGLTGHARHVIPMFANPKLNTKRNMLLLLTKTANTHYLEGLPTDNVVVSFSINPEPIADVWEGRWPDTKERITQPITDRLQASLQAQKMGFETRWRVDPILTPPGWEDMYEGFFSQAAGMGLRPARITFGTYRQKTPLLDTWREKWGLLPMEWEPADMAKHGTHFRLPTDKRVPTYRTMIALCEKYLPGIPVDLCKETHDLRSELGLCGSCCNCLSGSTR